MSRAAREAFSQALAAYKALGDESGTAFVLGNLAEMEFGNGQVERAATFGGRGPRDRVAWKERAELSAELPQHCRL